MKEIEEALLERRADFAVHSIKDVPGELPPGLVLACVPKREDPRDVLVAPRYRTIEALPAAGAGSEPPASGARCRSRRAAPISKSCPSAATWTPRLRKVDAGECDAIVLARAGLTSWLGAGGESHATPRDGRVSLPAVGQGALGIECRDDDAETRARRSPA